MDEEKRVIKSYNNVWKLNRTFYSIGGVNLPMPLTGHFVVYYIVFAVLLHIIAKPLPFSFKYVIIPAAGAWILDQKPIDGKNPYQFLKSILSYYFIIFFKGRKVSRFRHYKIQKVGIKSDIPCRIHQEVNPKAVNMEEGY